MNAPLADSDGEPLLAVRNLGVVFDGLRAVSNVGFTVETSSIVALVGPNGAGKTTVLNSISGFVPATGSIEFRGRQLLALPRHRRAAMGIGRTFQSVQLFANMTLLDNIVTGQHGVTQGNFLTDMLGFPTAERERLARGRALSLLQSFHIEQYAEQPAASLPFGVQKLAGVARAMATRPRLLLLDEPAAGLNRHESSELGRVIVSLRAELGVSVVLVEHNMRLVMGISDRIVVLHNGKVLAHGPPSEIGANPVVIEAYFGSS